MKNYYQILGVNPNASLVDIKVSFRALAFKWHPDTADSNLKNEAHMRFIEIYEAYSVISDTVHRKQYDILYYEEFVKKPYAQKNYANTKEREQEIYKASEDIKTYAKRARKLAESFAGDYIKNDDGFWSKLGDAYEFFFELPFILFDILTCYKKKCPSIEEIIYSAYHGYGEPQEALRRNIQIHTRFCSRCNKIDLFFTRVAEGASCPQWFRLRDFLTHPNLSMYKSDIIEQHILQCERCKCIAEIVRMKK